MATNAKPRRLNVLSLDGGGIRGLIPALLLAEMESYTGKKICQLFDVIAGTSTGGILALGLAKPKGRGSDEPEFTAGDLAKLYKEHGKTIFPKKVLQKIFSLGGMIEKRYPSSGLEGLLHRYFGKWSGEEAPDRKSQPCLSDALTKIVITSYEIETRREFFFRSANAQISAIKKEYDYLMTDVARATSAAPTYFEPARIAPAEIESDKVEENGWALIDGGVFANNPAMCAYVEALNIEDPDNITLVSLGTGEFTRPLPYEEAKGWGMIQWLQPILDVVFDGVSNTVEYQLGKLLKPKDYYRFQVKLEPKDSDAMDDVSEANIRNLEELGREMIELPWKYPRKDKVGLFEMACSKLLANKFYTLTNKDIARACRISSSKAAATIRKLDLSPELARECIGLDPKWRYAPEVLEKVRRALREQKT